MSTLFFFKQKTAYEIMPSLVGSEMCIRDSYKTAIKTCRKLEAQLEDAKAAMVKDSVEIKPVIDLRKKVDKLEEKW